MSQLGFYINVAECIGCKTCTIACKDTKDLEVGRNFRRVYSFEEGLYPKPTTFHISMACNHCDNPSCLEGCPTKALYKRKEDGVVLIDHDRCVGCRYCEWNCPYEAPQYSEELGKMTKCDTCIDLREQGEEPSCVSSCIMRAIEFGPIDELRAKYGDVADHRGLPNSKTTGPNLVIKSNI